MMKRKKTPGLLAALSIALLMLAAAPMLPMSGGGAYADEEVPAMVIGADVLAKDANSSGNTPILWFGTDAWYVIAYDGKERGTWVLKYNKPSEVDKVPLYQEGVITLFHKETTETSKFGFKDGGYAYKDSALENYLKTWLAGGTHAKFTAAEQRAIVSRTLPGGNNKVISFASEAAYYAFDQNTIRGNDTDALLWPLSMAEVSEIQGASAYDAKYWLRSPGEATNKVSYIDPAFPNHMPVQINGGSDDQYGVRPGLYMDHSLVQFISKANGGKASGEGAAALTAVGTNDGNEWVATLTDSSRGFDVKNVKTTGPENPGRLEIQYSGAVTGGNEYISAIVTNSDGRIIYYGRLGKASNAANASVTVDTAGKWNPEDGDKLYVFNEQYNNNSRSDLASKLIIIDEGIIDDDGTWSGAGTEEDPYVIAGSRGWNALADYVAEGNPTEGKYFKLRRKMTVSRTIGDYDKPFSGTLDGDGNTLTFNYLIDESTPTSFCAPFSYAYNATFKNLRITGEIKNKAEPDMLVEASGLICSASGECRITNCVSDIDIVNSTGTIDRAAGFVNRVAEPISAMEPIYSSVRMEGCAFTGSITGRKCAGFSSTMDDDSPPCGIRVYDCVYDGTVNASSACSNFTLAKGRTDSKNNYYTKAIGKYSDQGRQAWTLTTSGGIQVDFGKGTTYDVSGITAYGKGLSYNGIFRAGEGEQIAMTMRDPSVDDKRYVASSGKVIGSGTDYQIVMPKKDVVIREVPAVLPAAKNATIKVTASETGIISEVKAEWDAADSAAGYYLTPYRIVDGAWIALCNPIRISEPSVTDGRVSYDLSGKFMNDSNGGGTFGYRVQAYFGEAVESEAIESENTLELYHVTLHMGDETRSLRARSGSCIGEIIRSIIGEPIYKYVCFTTRPEYEYSSLKELKADACYTPSLEDEKAYPVTEDVEVFPYVVENFCPAAEERAIHKWRIVLNKATTEQWGTYYYECDECGKETDVMRIAPASGFEINKAPYTFTGRGLEPAVIVKDRSGSILRKGTDYTVAYSNNRDVGTGTAKITLIGKRKGSKELSFRIKPASISAVSVSDIGRKPYTGKEIKPEPVVKLGDVILQAGRDYEILYADNTDIGTAKAYVVGNGNLSGLAVRDFAITKAENPLQVNGKTATIKYRAAKKKNQKLAVTKVICFTGNGQGTVTYTKAGGNKKITINKTTGQVIVKKGIKKGSYTITVNVQAAGNANYLASPVRTATFTVKVK